MAGLLGTLIIAALLLTTPVAAEICWGKICTTSPFRDSGLCGVCCGGHGKCVSFNKCECNSGWKGDNCDIPTFCGLCPSLCNVTQSGVCTGRLLRGMHM